MSTQPRVHPQRALLHNEIHARPHEAMSSFMAITHWVMWADENERSASREHLVNLLREQHQALPGTDSTHLRVDLGGFRLRWELHTEFVTWTFMVPLQTAESSDHEPRSAMHAVPQDWLASLPGQCLSRLDLWVLPSAGHDPSHWVRRLLSEEALVASTVVDGHGEVYTDFLIHPDGASRMLLLAGSITPRRLGRVVQQLLEIETYRMTALLGLPAAREVSNQLASAERELAELAESIRSVSREAEPALLDRLTRLAGHVESLYASTHSRFSASSAYFALVDKRIAELGESRLAGMQTVREFMDRRLSPARSTCEWAVRRQDALSQRISRMSNLLRTRVEIEQQQSSQALLTTMNQRQDMQLKLQSTVEGLSVAAITYYIVGLLSYLAKGAGAYGWPLSPESTAALAIPVVALGVWISLKRLHRRVFHS